MILFSSGRESAGDGGNFCNAFRKIFRCLLQVFQRALKFELFLHFLHIADKLIGEMAKNAEERAVDKLAAGFAQARPAIHSLKEARSKRLQCGDSLPSAYRAPGFILHVVYDGIKRPASG